MGIKDSFWAFIGKFAKGGAKEPTPEQLPEVSGFKLGKPQAQRVIDNAKWKGVIIDGSTFPDDPYREDLLRPNSFVLTKYLPAFDKAFPTAPNGLKLLCTIMTMVEGFRPGTRSYDQNNPGNIGNTDSGANKSFSTLEAGITKQVEHLKAVAAGQKAAYPFGKLVYLPPSFSKEMQNNKKNYMVTSGDLPGYRFTYTGQLDQFFKIYATLSRVRNDYINRTLTFFAYNGIALTPQSKLADIIQMG